MDITHVTPRSDFHLLLTFADGQKRVFDMKPLLAMKPWNRVARPEIFALAKVNYGTVVWPGEIDVAPETLLLDSRPVLASQA